MTALSVIILLHTLHKGSHALELKQILKSGIDKLKEEIEKRAGDRKPCGFTWKCNRRRGRRRTRKGWSTKRNGLSHFDELVPRSQDDLFGTLERDSNEEI